MIDVSYDRVYEDYVRFCTVRGIPPQPFEYWMKMRDNRHVNTLQQEADRILSLAK